jgi:hypothetical protein
VVGARVEVRAQQPRCDGVRFADGHEIVDEPVAALVGQVGLGVAETFEVAPGS